MPSVAAVQTTVRTVVSFFVRPLQDQIARAFRESGVTVPVEVALDLFEGDLGRQVSRLLSNIPTDAVLLARKRPNLRVLTGIDVSKLLIENGSRLLGL